MAGNALKIGLVVDDTLDKPDGVQQYVLTIGEWLRSQGHAVHYLAGQTRRTDITPVHSLSRNVAVRFNGNRLTIPLPASRRKLRRLLAKENFDVLHIQMPYSPMLAHKIIGEAPASTAVIGTFHILPESRLAAVGTKLLGVWLRSSLRRFNHVYAVSAAAKDFASSSFALQNVTVLPNAVNVAAFRSGVTAMSQDRNDPIIMFFGRLVPRKGCSTFLRAAAELRLQYDKPFKVQVCGKGPLLDDLKAEADRLGIRDLTTFSGFIAEADKANVLAAARIAAYPSSGGESFGIVLVEAMAVSNAASGNGPAGPVVLAASNPGYASVFNGRNEQLFAPGDHKALAALMAHYLGDTAAADQARQWQRLHVRQFDVASVGQRLLAGYRSHLRK